MRNDIQYEAGYIIPVGYEPTSDATPYAMPVFDMPLYTTMNAATNTVPIFASPGNTNTTYLYTTNVPPQTVNPQQITTNEDSNQSKVLYLIGLFFAFVIFVGGMIGYAIFDRH